MQATKRKDGRWYCRVFIGTVDGQKKYRHVYADTRGEAEAEAAAIKRDVSCGADFLAPDSFGYWADQWLSARKAETTANQYENDAGKIDRILKWCPSHRTWSGGRDSVERISIMKLKPYELQSLIDSLALTHPVTGKPAAKKTLTDYRNVIRAVCAFAVYNRALTFDPSARLVIPKTAAEDTRRALTRAEQDRILGFDHRARLPALLMTYCGLRVGEVTALTWSDVDLTTRQINVDKTYDFKQGQLKPPKTKSGVRRVPIPDRILPFLTKAEREKRGVLVVTTAEGRRMNPTTWKRLLNSYLADLNLEYGGFIDKPSKYAPTKAPMLIDRFTWHCLRHTYATILYDAGVDVLTAQKLLGHADAKTTMTIYTHLSREKEQLNIEKLNSYLGALPETKATTS